MPEPWRPTEKQEAVLLWTSRERWTGTSVIAQRAGVTSHIALSRLQALYTKAVLDRRKSANGVEWEWKRIK